MQILSFKSDMPENNWHQFAFLRFEKPTNTQLQFYKIYLPASKWRTGCSSMASFLNVMAFSISVFSGFYGCLDIVLSQKQQQQKKPQEYKSTQIQLSYRCYEAISWAFNVKDKIPYFFSLLDNGCIKWHKSYYLHYFSCRLHKFQLPLFYPLTIYHPLFFPPPYALPLSPSLSLAFFPSLCSISAFPGNCFWSLLVAVGRLPMVYRPC